MMKKSQRRMVQWGLLALGILIMGFGYQFPQNNGAETTADPDLPDETLYYADITYQLSWSDQSPINWQGDVNDLGYTIWLDEGYLASATIEMIPCLSDDEPIEAAFWGPRVAYAGHGVDGYDESRLVLAYVEALSDAGEHIVMDVISVSDEIYCQAHYLVSPTLIEASGADADMSRSTIQLSGRYQASESDIQTPFLIETDMAWGALVDLQNDAAEQVTLQTGFAPATIAIERDLSQLFMGVDFIGMTAQEQQMSVLRSLMNNIAVRVE